MNIFENDSEVLQIGALTIENQTDSVIVVGNVQIYKNLAGREQAQALFEFAKALMATFDGLSEQELADFTIQEPAVRLVENPFE